jgi:hypothetical protein
MSGEPVVQWVADGDVEGEAQVLARVQTQPYPPRIHVLAPGVGWREDVQLRLHRMGSGSGWLVTEDEAHAIGASWGYALLDAWDDTAQALDDSSRS